MTEKIGIKLGNPKTIIAGFFFLLGKESKSNESPKIFVQIISPLTFKKYEIVSASLQKKPSFSSLINNNELYRHLFVLNKGSSNSCYPKELISGKAQFKCNLNIQEAIDYPKLRTRKKKVRRSGEVESDLKL